MGKAAAALAMAARPNGGTHPLLAALIDELPPRGADWFGRAEREAWLRMMATAFDVVYGPLDGATALPSLGEAKAAIAAGAAVVTAPAEPVAPRSRHAGHDFFVSPDGTVCSADGAPVAIADVPAEEMIFDYRPVAGDFRDLACLAWADGTRGTAGLAAGVGFCGPG